MRVFLVCLVLFSIGRHVLGEKAVGGQWHEEAMAAWKEYNKGTDRPEEELAYFLQHGRTSDLARFYELACTKGSANFCFLAGSFDEKKNAKKAAEFYSKGCGIAQDLNNCMGAVTNYLKTNQMEKAKDTFKDFCNEGGRAFQDSVGVLGWCDFSMSKPSEEKKFLKVISKACSEGHAVSCSILEKHGIKHRTPKTASAAEQELLKKTAKNEQIEKGWDGKYETAACATAKECKSAGDRKPEKYEVERIPFFAKACTFGDGGSCGIVGQYEEDRKDEAGAYSWFKKGCDNAPETTVLCLEAVEAALRSNDMNDATVLFLKVCEADRDGVCENQIIGSRNGPASSQYLKLLKQTCHDGNRVSCKVLPRFESKES